MPARERTAMQLFSSPRAAHRLSEANFLYNRVQDGMACILLYKKGAIVLLVRN